MGLIYNILTDTGCLIALILAFIIGSIYFTFYMKLLCRVCGTPSENENDTRSQVTTNHIEDRKILVPNVV